MRRHTNNPSPQHAGHLTLVKNQMNDAPGDGADMTDGRMDYVIPTAEDLEADRLLELEYDALPNAAEFEILSCYLDGAMTEEESRAVEERLETDDAFRQLAEPLFAVESLPDPFEVKLSPEELARGWQAVLDDVARLKGQGAPALTVVDTSESAPSTRPNASRVRQLVSGRSLRRLAIPLGIAASIVIGMVPIASSPVATRLVARVRGGRAAPAPVPSEQPLAVGGQAGPIDIRAFVVPAANVHVLVPEVFFLGADTPPRQGKVTPPPPVSAVPGQVAPFVPGQPLPNGETGQAARNTFVLDSVRTAMYEEYTRLEHLLRRPPSPGGDSANLRTASDTLRERQRLRQYYDSISSEMAAAAMRKPSLIAGTTVVAMPAGTEKTEWWSEIDRERGSGIVTVSSGVLTLLSAANGKRLEVHAGERAYIERGSAPRLLQKGDTTRMVPRDQNDSDSPNNPNDIPQNHQREVPS